MATTIVESEKGYGFALTRFAGGKERGRCYQIDVGASHVELTHFQMLQLVAAFITDHNKLACNPEQS